jgi:mannose-1-phosphate guanylyltransferase/mannose-6-phosphate isomerase
VRRALLFSRPDEVYAITGAAHRFLAADHLAEIDAPCRVLTEPEGKNTLPAIGGALQRQEKSLIVCLDDANLLRAGGYTWNDTTLDREWEPITFEAARRVYEKDQ